MTDKHTQLDETALDNQVVTSTELYVLKDKAHLYDLIMQSHSFVSFYAGYDGQGGAFRETLVSPRDHYDSVLYNQAMRKAKKIGASSWCVFKPVGVSHNVDYGRNGEESRLDFITMVSDLVVTDPEANSRISNPQNNPQEDRNGKH